MLPERHDMWTDFSPQDALHWCRVLIRHSPDPRPAGIKAVMWTTLEEGRPLGVPAWVTVATAARDDGFTPVLYESLFRTFTSIEASAFTSHPHRRQVTHPRSLPGTPYESVLWQPWPRLVLDEEFSPRDATTLCLLYGERLFPHRRG
ncbi:hypothetical protein GCM10009700_14140 [Brevibacterium sanguinis]